MSKLLLGINIDYIATLRNVYKMAYPDLFLAVFVAERAGGADTITVHP